MSVYTPVSPEQIRAWLRHYSIGALVGLEGIAGGVENTNYFVTTTQGRYVLTLFERLGRAELAFYIHLMAHLARHGIPCPAPVADQDDGYLGTLNGKPAALVAWLRGEAVNAPEPRHCAALGALLAAMHGAAQSYGRRLDNPRGPRWRREAAAEVMPLLPADEQEMLGEELRFQALYRLEDLPRGVIHGDLFRDNVLFDSVGDAVRIGGVIDFYFAGTDSLLLDLAITANDWCIDARGELDAERTVALLRAYHEVRPLTALERGAWPVLLRAASLRFWLSRLHDLHLPRSGEMVLRKDPGHFRDILRRRSAAGSSQPWPAIASS